MQTSHHAYGTPMIHQEEESESEESANQNEPVSVLFTFFFFKQAFYFVLLKMLRHHVASPGSSSYHTFMVWDKRQWCSSSVGIQEASGTTRSPGTLGNVTPWRASHTLLVALPADWLSCHLPFHLQLHLS